MTDAIRVLVVEDSPIALNIIKRILDSSPDIEVVGTARTGKEALSLIPEIHPDVVCTDFYMPQMDGREFILHVMAQYPLPVLVISAAVRDEDEQNVYQLLEAGAVDTFPKPTAGLDARNTVLQKSLIDRIKVLSGVKVFRKNASPTLLQNGSRSTATRCMSTDNNARSRPRRKHVRPAIIALGASTGGPLALQEILTPLPANFPLPIVCVQHISLGFLSGLVNWLEATCRLPIEIAKSGEQPQPGKVYFPQEHQHLHIDAGGRFIHSQAPALDNHRPSITVTFESLAQFYGAKTIGVLLTGMGRDGADGMKAIADAGGLTIAQDEPTSVVFGMPKEAIELGAVDQVLPIQAIAPTLLKLIQP